MAAFLYDECRRSIGGIPTHTVIDFDADTLEVFFVDEGDDTPSQTSDVDAADRLEASQVPDFDDAPAIANNASTISSNVLVVDGDDCVFTALTGDQAESYDIFKNSGTEGTSPLISNHDDATGLPLTPSGGNVTIVFHATGILRI